MVGDGDQVQDNTGSSVAVSVALALGDDLGQVKGKGQTSRTRNKGQGTRDKGQGPCLALPYLVARPHLSYTHHSTGLSFLFHFLFLQSLSLPSHCVLYPVVELGEGHLHNSSSSGGGGSSQVARRWPCEASTRTNAVVSLCPIDLDLGVDLGVDVDISTTRTRKRRSTQGTQGAQEESEEGEVDASCCQQNNSYVVGRRSGQVDVLDLATGKSRILFRTQGFASSSNDSESDTCSLVGVRRTKPSGPLVSCTSKGIVELWDKAKRNSSAETESSLLGKIGEVEAGSHVESFEVDKSGRFFATGGRENNLKLFDIEKQESVFLARSPKPNELGIWDKPWISSLLFVDESSNLVLCGTANHQLRMYDARVKRRPVFELEWGENKITSLCLETSGQSVWCGNAIGRIFMLDLKMKSMNGSLKGTMGSVRSLCRHPTKPLLFSCGLDRFLRVYNVNKRQQVCSVYLKQYMNTMDIIEEEGKGKKVDDETDGAENGGIGNGGN